MVEAASNPKLIKLRELMSSKDLQGYLIFHFDEHKSEYLADADERIKFISGFAGSNAISLVTKEKALLWTDSRYYIQAERQLEAGWEMMKMDSGSVFYNDWVRDNMAEGDKIGVDATTMPISGFELRTKTFKEKGKELV
jgi:Xaa-Pro aminopeptidase